MVNETAKYSHEGLEVLADIVRYFNDDTFRESLQRTAEEATGGNVSALDALLWKAEMILEDSRVSVDGVKVCGHCSGEIGTCDCSQELMDSDSNDYRLEHFEG